MKEKSREDHRLCPVLAIKFAVCLSVAPLGQAATVNTCDEASLRAALASDGSVLFNCDGTIVLTSTITISNHVTLDASGRDVTISGSNAVRLFMIAPGATFAPVALTLADGYVVGTNGSRGQPGGPGDGGAIYNNGGTLLASSCLFVRNVARGGNGGVNSLGLPVGAGGPGRGGAAYNGPGGRIILSNCEFRVNQALGGDSGRVNLPSSGVGGNAAGGALYNADGTLQLVDCVASSNRVVSGRVPFAGQFIGSGLACGGAIFNGGGDTVLYRVVASNNDSIAAYVNDAYGGVFYHMGGTSEVSDCRLTGNRALGGRGTQIPFGTPGGGAFGGAVSVVAGDLRIIGTTLDHNLAMGGAEDAASPAGLASGGAIYNTGDVAMTNSTLTANRAQSGPAYPLRPGRALGGAVANDGGSLSLSHLTIAGNAVSQSGGGAVGDFLGGGLFATNGTVRLYDTIVANNSPGSNCFGVMVDGGHNISSDDSANFAAPGSLNNTDPVLGPLEDYGGSTLTMALLAGSPAIDAADAASCPETDQRGLIRPFGAGCDIGAFESSPPYTILGRITGYTTPASGITLSVGSSSTPLGANGQYAMHGLATGSYTVTPLCSEAVFLLSNRVVAVGPDLVGLDFNSYRSNALTMERISSGIVRAVFAGEAGQTHRVLLSTTLPQWESYSTNTVQPSGIFDFFETNSASPLSRFFNVVMP